ncbi:myosin heavy chain, striated muscle-like isoform X2 [Lytechinus variegatus]|uniref:myosin heavy chain, striated muscle-like isoform X1 n=1 Tax=Lytechinus variegatus TaxID=7654 RepID=UPI001BB22B05|nr:myosin heavy chain, striated muscle-like isoform X1 [Lytechinus variegatus]XP_041455980.1 myosin heavy chain, striated muscle-like isoform X2 [Lytechinus variegatus]
MAERVMEKKSIYQDDNMVQTSEEESSDDTSAWDSDPVTQRQKSSRQYHPVRGQPEDVSQSGGSDEDDPDPNSNMEGKLENGKMFRVGLDNGDKREAGRERRMEGRSGLRDGGVRAQINGGGHHRSNRASGSDDLDDDLDNGQEEEDGSTASEGDGEVHSNEISSKVYKGQEQFGREDKNDDGMKEDQEEEDIEEIDLTREHLQQNFLRMNNGESQFQQSRVMYLPSFGFLGPTSLGPTSLGPTSLNAVMGDLFAGAPSLDINQSDSGSNFTGNDQDEGLYNDYNIESQSCKEGRPREDDENLGELFTTLRLQHEEQMKAQQDHHRKQLQWLKNQLITERNDESFQNGAVDHGPATSGVRPHVQGASTEEGDSGETQSQDVDSAHASGQVNLEEVPLLDQAENNSETSTCVSSSLDITQMTTWSDVHGHRQSGEAHRNLHQQAATATEAAILEEMQRNFELEQAALHQEYQSQVNRLQQEWLTQQQMQTHQKQLVEDMLQQQEKRLQQMTQLQKDAEETSSIYSDFTYWKLEEGDTYKDLPHSKPRGGQPSMERDSLLSDDAQNTPQDEMVSSKHLNKNSNGAKLVESPRTSSNRIDLQEKYSRHIADMEAYYEGELEDLRKQLAQARLASSAIGNGHGEELVGADTSKLYRHCQQLQTSLAAANSRIQDLENTVKALESRLLEWPDRYSLANTNIEILQKRADGLLHLVKQREDDFNKLDRENRKLQYELLEAQEQQQSQQNEGKRDQVMLSKLIAKLTQLTEQHDNTQAELLKVQMKLEEANLSITDLKRTAVRQELEIRQLEGEKKKLLNHHDDLRLMVSPFPTSPLPSSTRLQSGIGETQQSVKNLNGVNSSLRSPSETRPNLSEGSPHHDATSAKSPSSVGDSLRLSVEDRKFLRSGANYNILTGGFSGAKAPSIDVTNSTTEQRDVISPIQAITSPRDTLHAPFDSDLEERPLSPMMKAAAQFDRWQSSGKSPRSQYKSSQSPTVPGISSHLNSTEIPVRDLPVRKNETNVDQLVSYKKRTKDEKNGGRRDKGRQIESKDENIGLRVRVSAAPVLDKEKERSAKTASYKKLSTIADIIQPGKNDSSLHVWALHQSPDTAMSSKTRNSKASPRQGVADSPSQAARKNLAKYSLKDGGGTGGSERKKRTSPRRNLSASFQASEKKNKDGMNLRKGEMSSKSVQTPGAGEDSLEATLQNVREGHVITRADWENGFAESRLAADKNAKRMTSKTAETPEAILKRLSKESKKLDDLMLEKRKLESALSHLPNSGPANAKRIEQQEKLEERLDQVTRELGSVRMLLRKYNALNMSF